MPFAELPSSKGFVPPQAPDWGQFASQAINLRAHQPIPNTAEMVNQAVQQIDHILQLQSPQAKLQREVQMRQLDMMKEVYTDYKAHPEKYQMTAHGPVLIDPYARIERIARAKHALASADYLTKKTQGAGTPAFIADATKRMQAAVNAENQGVKLPGSGQTDAEPVANAQTTGQSSDSAAVTDALTPEPETPEETETAPTDIYGLK